MTPGAEAGSPGPLGRPRSFASDAAPSLEALGELSALVVRRPGLFVRFSAGPEADRGAVSRDYESDLELPGLSVNSLDPEPWWTRPLDEWLARRLCNYAHLAEEIDDRNAWVLVGHRVGRGPDNEPLVVPTEVVAVLTQSLLDQARRVYEERFCAGKDPRHVG